MQKMQISSSNSEHNSESDYSQKGDDSDFEKAFNKVFRYEMNNEQKYDEPEEVPYFLKTTKIYEEDLKSKDKLNSEKELIYDHNLNKEIIENKEEKIEKMILEVPEKGAVQIKNSWPTKFIAEESGTEFKPKIFTVDKIEEHIAFIPAKFKKYYEKYKNDFIFKVMKEKKSRKEDPDEIRKKIKSRFFKSLKICINKELDRKGINKKFEYLPQSFISNISKGETKTMLDKTLKQIILDISYSNKVDEKLENNLNLLKYLEEDEISKDNCKINKIHKIFHTQIRDLFNEYLKSEEFELSIIKLKEEGNYFDYIKSYINEADNFINFFSN